MNRRLERVNVASLRVALISTGIVAAIYTIMSVVVVMAVTNNLTSQVDIRLAAALAHYEVSLPRSDTTGRVGDTGQGGLNSPALVWLLYAGRQVTSIADGTTLPETAADVSGPTTIEVKGVDVRVAGAELLTTVGPARLVVGFNVDSVSQAKSSLIVAEAAAGIVLLILVFSGTLLVGRRVGAPIELARQRQLEFTADASHELRTPLAVIEAQTSLALSQDRDPAWYRQAFQRVGSESGRIRRLVDDLLWLARVDTPQGRPSAEPVEVGVLVQQAAERFAAVAESRGITLQVSVGLGPLAVMGSSTWLDRLLGVLLDNAFKYAPAGGTVGLSAGVDGNRVRVVVEDSGPGIPEDERPKIFDRFHRAIDQGYGSGLGLAIADAVVRHTHGRWEVSTSALGGARMAVSWQRALAGSRDQAEADPAVSWTVAGQGPVGEQG
ncbi:MAG TPA: HAMP domain-containing sensor histidine kinase [Candidatus Acidoferrales bacterium]|nr:HAMP domain-containing sensor histidine kinase [Candidatus Acidoferrales bacterium]